MNYFLSVADSLFGDTFSTRYERHNPIKSQSSWAESQETESGVLVLNFEVPGYAKEDLKISVLPDGGWYGGRNVVVTGKRKGNKLRQYRYIGPGYDYTNVKATCKNGLLRIELRKKETATPDIKIEIE